MIPNFIYNNQTLPVQLTHRKGMKRMTLRVSKTADAILVSAPPRMPLREVIHFVGTSRSWIETQLIKKPPMNQSFTPNMILTLAGKDYLLLHEEKKRRSFELCEDSLIIRGPLEHFEWMVGVCLKKIAAEKCSYWSGVLAEKLGLVPQKITIKDVKGRWGSCSSQGNLNYNWRIILAPEPVLIYLCAHEVSHLRHMNHSAEFWTLVASVCPEHLVLRRWLKKNGDHLYRFG